MNFLEIIVILGGIGSFIGGVVAFVQFYRSLSTTNAVLAEQGETRESPTPHSIPGKPITLALPRNKLFVIGVFAAVIGVVLLTYVAPSLHCQLLLRSPDGKYQAISVGDGKNIHYQIKDERDQRIVFTTRAQYDTPNDVKAGTFSSDSKEFAAAYHYGHDGGYTWIGVWNVTDSTLVRTEKRSGWTTNICSAVKK
ncbi:hypothetical protein KKB18_02030 [bacterium]|nr:hypothetical protein [bacterium]